MPVGRVELDLTAVAHFSTAGLLVLCALSRAGGDRLKVTAMSRSILRVLTSVRLEPHLRSALLGANL